MTERAGLAAEPREHGPHRPPAAHAGLSRWLVQHAIKAPSLRNSQPWRFRIGDETIELLADRTRALPVADPSHRELMVACGAALHHLRVAAREAGYEPVVDRRPQTGAPDLLARVRLVPTNATTDGDRALFAAMHNRSSQRVPFAAEAPPQRLIDRFAQLGSDSTLEVRTITDRTTILALADLVREAQARQFTDTAYRHEAAKWDRPNRSGHGDGVPGFVAGLNRVQALAEPAVLRRLAVPGPPDHLDADLAAEAPLLVVVSTDGDGPMDWVQAGETLSDLLLRLTAAGLCASFLSQPMEVAQLRRRLRSMLRLTGFPQLMIRVGSAPDFARPTPRRRTDEVIET